LLDELLICQIASAHHENVEFDHCLLSLRLCAKLTPVGIAP
jgi:hypothetical protein